MTIVMWILVWPVKLVLALFFWFLRVFLTLGVELLGVVYRRSVRFFNAIVWTAVLTILAKYNIIPGELWIVGVLIVWVAFTTFWVRKKARRDKLMRMQVDAINKYVNPEQTKKGAQWSFANLKAAPGRYKQRRAARKAGSRVDEQSLQDPWPEELEPAREAMRAARQQAGLPPEEEEEEAAGGGTATKTRREEKYVEPQVSPGDEPYDFLKRLDDWQSEAERHWRNRG